MAGGFVVGAAALAATVQSATPPAAGSPLNRVLAGVGVPLPREAIAQAPLILPDWHGTERINVLLLGVDQQDEELRVGESTRSDSLIVVSIDPVAKTAALISFPRDMWLTIPGYGEHRINEAYPIGELYRVPGGGPGLVARTLDHNFGLIVPYYAVVNFSGFVAVVDTMGGIVVDVPRPVKDDEYPTTNFGVERIYIALGPQLMDGALALKYARTRHGDTDLHRNARQQQVLLAIRDRVLRPDIFVLLPTLVEQGMRTVKTNFTPTELLALAKLASQTDTSSLRTLVIQHPLVTDFRGSSGQALLLPQKDEIRFAIHLLLHSPADAAPASGG